jgi:hypothetical protein
LPFGLASAPCVPLPWTSQLTMLLPTFDSRPVSVTFQGKGIARIEEPRMLQPGELLKFTQQQQQQQS